MVTCCRCLEWAVGVMEWTVVSILHSVSPLPLSLSLSLSHTLVNIVYVYFNYTYSNQLSQVKAVLDEILEKLPEEFNMLELQSKTEEKTPYILVALQECERMNVLTREIRRSLKELDLGLKVRRSLGVNGVNLIN